MVVVDVYIAISLVGWLVGSVCQTDRHTKRVRERERERGKRKSRAQIYVCYQCEESGTATGESLLEQHTNTCIHIYTHIFQYGQNLFHCHIGIPRRSKYCLMYLLSYGFFGRSGS